MYSNAMLKAKLIPFPISCDDITEVIYYAMQEHIPITYKLFRPLHKPWSTKDCN